MTTLEFLLRAMKAMVEVAGCAFLGQGIVAMFAGAERDKNFVYSLFRILTNPVSRFARIVSPRFVPDRHIPWVALGLLVWLWIALILGIAYVRLNGL
jgi:hypothetical protein